MNIDAQRVHSIMRNLHHSLLKQKNYLNGLNVFPVPDGDTGLNMTLTMQAALTNTLPDRNVDIPGETYLREFAKNMLLGSRGCSGVILSLYCKGVSEVLSNGDFSAEHVSEALRNGYESAYTGISNPTEGTILTIMRELYRHYDELVSEESDPARIITRSIPYLKEVLSRTPEMLPVLKKAGVVDSGGAGFIILLEGLSQELDDNHASRKAMPVHSLLKINNNLRRLLRRNRSHREIGAFLKKGIAQHIHLRKLESIIDQTRRFLNGGSPARETILQDIDDLNSSWDPDLQYRYCTELVLDTSALVDEQQLKTLLMEMGDSLMVLQDIDVFKIHIHTNIPDDVIDAVSQFGQLSFSKIDDMKKQHRNFISDRSVEYERERSLFCIVSGDGFKDILLSMGADDVLDYGRRKPSVGQLVKHINRLAAKNVIVAADDRDILMALKYAVSLSKSNVSVLESDSVISLIGMLMGLSGNQDINRTVHEVMERFIPIRFFAVARAVKPSQTIEGDVIRKGELFAIHQGVIVTSGRNALELIESTLNILREGESLVTLYIGSGAKKNRAGAEVLQARLPAVQFEEYYGGQHKYLYYVTLE